MQGSEKSGRHHRGGDQVFRTILSPGILKFVRIRQTSQRRRSGIPDILIFRNPDVRQDQVDITEEEIRYIPDILISRNPEVRQDQADITEEEIRYIPDMLIFRNPEVRQDQADITKEEIRYS